MNLCSVKSVVASGPLYSLLATIFLLTVAVSSEENSHFNEILEDDYGAPNQSDTQSSSDQVSQRLN